MSGIHIGATALIEIIYSGNHKVKPVVWEVKALCDVGACWLQNQLNTSGVGWGVQMMYYNITTPGGINATVKDNCRDKFGHWCLGEL